MGHGFDPPWIQSKHGTTRLAQYGDPLLLDAFRALNAEEIDTASDPPALVVFTVPSHEPLAGRVRSLVERAHQLPVHVEELDAHVPRTRGPERERRPAPRRILRGETRAESLRRTERELGRGSGRRETDRLVDLDQTL